MGVNHAVTKSPKEKAAAKARQLAGLRNGNASPPGVSLFEKTKPRITPDRAADFVKLLSSGFTPKQALLYLFPDKARGRPTMSKIQHRDWLKEWMTSPLVITATSDFNGGEWHTLDHERQIEVALDQLDAQMARFLYTCDYASLDAPIAKIADARNALLSRLKSKEGNEGGFETMMRELLEGKLNAGPPQLSKGGLPVVKRQDIES